MYYNKDTKFPVPSHLTWDIQDSSKIKTYMECPRKYFYEYVLGWKSDRPNIHLIFGGAWHKALEFKYKKPENFSNIREAFRDHFLPYYRQYIDPADDEIYSPKNPQRAYLALAYYSEIYKDRPREYSPVIHEGVPMIEIGGTINLTEDRVIAFKMDTILQGPKGIVSIEHKTGSSSYGWSDQWYLATSIGTYTHALYCMYSPEEVAGIIVSGTFFKKTKDDPKKDAKEPFRHFDHLEIPIYRQPESMNVWLNNTLWWLDLIEWDFKALGECKDSDPIMRAFMQRAPECSGWGGCPYLSYCLGWANPLQRCERPPLGMKIDFWNPLEEEVNVSLDI